MDYLQISKYGNTIQDYLISLAIFAASCFIARFVYQILRNTICDWVALNQAVFEKQNLNRVSALASSLIPIVGLAVARNRLTLDVEIATWISIGLLISGQIIFLLIVLNIIDPIVEVLPIKYMRSAEHYDQKYLEIQTQAVEKARRHIRQLITILLVLIPALTILSHLAVVPYAFWGLPAIIFIIELTFCLRAIFSPKRYLREREAAESTEEIHLETEVLPPPNDPDLKIKQEIATFFLEMHKHQQKALKECQVEYRLVDLHTFAPNYIYELRFKKYGTWQSRRMTIGPIGEDTGSRSKCFYVIYDDHLVIKIPPTPITDLNQYMKIISKERTIVRKLAMEECIIPGVSVILKLIQPSADKATISLEETENNYIKLLDIFPELQKYLRIGDSFVFFMDLSKYYFLGHVIQAFHATERKVSDEISRHSEVVGDYTKFADAHGRENAQIFLEIEKIYAKYETELKNLMAKFDISSPLPQKQTKKWFFTHLVGKEVTDIQKGLNALFVAELNTLIDSIINENIAAVQSYRESVKQSIYKSAFTQNKVYMEGIVTNLLELLVHLKEKGVAMRDLKPDNLFVAGEREKYPGFLAYPEDYKIGLIDVETAVIFKQPTISAIDQPPLGGTPQYATPSHLFQNQLLNSVYGDLAKILHLQDWYATIAMIFRTVTGEHLFQTTAGLFPTIVKMINISGKEVAELSNVLEKVSQMFWSKSLAEFNAKINEKKDVLESLNIYLSKSVKKMLHRHIQEEQENIADKLKQCVITESVSISDKDRQYLLSCSHERIQELKQKWENGAKTNKAVPSDGTHITELLRNLEGLKRQLERKARTLELLDQSTSKISVYDLLGIMFQIVLERMYREEWGTLLSEDPDDFAEAAGDTADQATIIEATREWQTVTEQI